jgi:hypothetical protein
MCEGWYLFSLVGRLAFRSRTFSVNLFYAATLSGADPELNAMIIHAWC